MVQTGKSGAVRIWSVRGVYTETVITLGALFLAVPPIVKRMSPSGGVICGSVPVASMLNAPFFRTVHVTSTPLLPSSMVLPTLVGVGDRTSVTMPFVLTAPPMSHSTPEADGHVLPDNPGRDCSGFLIIMYKPS